MKIDSWDREFETEADYNVRVSEAEVKALPIRNKKKAELTSVKREMLSVVDKQINPLKKQLKILKDKRFSVSASEISFKFLSYDLGSQKMAGKLNFDNRVFNFKVVIPNQKARIYKKQPDLLVIEVKLQAGFDNAQLYSIMFHVRKIS